MWVSRPSEIRKLVKRKKKSIKVQYNFTQVLSCHNEMLQEYALTMIISMFNLQSRLQWT